MSPSSIILSMEDHGVARVTLNRPEVHNAFDDVLIAQLTATVRRLDADPAIRVMILDAAGKSFSAGADLNWMKKMSTYSWAENTRDSMELANLMSSIYHMTCTTIAAVQGAAYGGGVGLVACCDIAIASTQASFSFSEVKLGLIPAVISPYIIAAMGARASQRYFATAERFDARRAVELGLVSECVEADELKPKINSLADLIIKNGPEAVIAAKRLVRDVSQQPIDNTLQSLTAERIAAMRSSEQGKEGVNAFLEKRAPQWGTE